MTAAGPGGRPFSQAGGVFGRLHRRMAGPLPDLSALQPAAIAPELLAVARRTWQQRAQSELRSVQIMARFLGEVVNAPLPQDVYAGTVELVQDEIRHTELCAAVAAALGAPATLPEPLELREPAAYLAAPAGERALTTAIGMLAINETISVAFIADLRARCSHPALAPVLAALLDDEEDHGAFGWSFVERALATFPASTLRDWRHLVAITLAPHQRAAEQALAEVHEADRRLDAFPEPDLAELGLLSLPREALLFRRAFGDTLAPKLRALGLLP